MQNDELEKLIRRLAYKTAFGKVFGNRTIPDDEEPLETALVQQLIDKYPVPESFMSTNNSQKDNAQNPQITPLFNLKAVKTHSENPITKISNKIREGFETPKPRELSQIPMEIKDPNQWHIDSAPSLPEVKNESRSLAGKILDKTDKYKDLTVMEALQKAASKLPLQNTEAGYYGISTKMSDGEDMSKKAKEQNTFYKLKNIKDPEIAKNLREKMAKSKGLDVNNPKDYQTLQNSSVVVPKVDSDLYKYAKNSETTKRWIADNYDKFENGTIKNKDKHITYPASVVLPDKRALNLTIHNADLTTSKVNKNKSMQVGLGDVYDFDEMKKQHTNTLNPINMGKQALHNVISDINNNAYSQQAKEQLEPYGLTMPVYYTPEEIEEIKKKYQNRKKRH